MSPGDPRDPTYTTGAVPALFVLSTDSGTFAGAALAQWTARRGSWNTRGERRWLAAGCAAGTATLLGVGCGGAASIGKKNPKRKYITVTVTVKESWTSRFISCRFLMIPVPDCRETGYVICTSDMSLSSVGAHPPFPRFHESSLDTAPGGFLAKVPQSRLPEEPQLARTGDPTKDSRT